MGFKDSHTLAKSTTKKVCNQQEPYFTRGLRFYTLKFPVRFSGRLTLLHRFQQLFEMLRRLGAFLDGNGGEDLDDRRF